MNLCHLSLYTRWCISYIAMGRSYTVGGDNITTYQKRILNDINTVQRDKAYKFEDIIPLAMNRELWKALCNSM